MYGSMDWASRVGRMGVGLRVIEEGPFQIFGSKVLGSVWT